MDWGTLPDLSWMLRAGAMAQNENERRQGEASLLALLDGDRCVGFAALTNEIVCENKDRETRRIAGAVLKNAVGKAKDGGDWLALPVPLREQIKDKLVNTLPSNESFAAEAAVSVITAIALIELPHSMWAALIPTLMDIMGRGNLQSKVSAVTVLGFVCEEIDSQTLKGRSRLY